MKTNNDCVSGLKYLVLILLIINIFTFIDINEDSDINYIKTTSEVILPSVPKVIKVDDTTTINNDKLILNGSNNNKVLTTYYGNISHYGPDCSGCSGKTATGYNVSGGNIYYNDKTYGLIRIVAADGSIPFGTIVRLNMDKGQVIAIVLDRGDIGFNKKFLFDLLCESEKESYILGVNRDTKIEILRYGF